ncbi:MAG: sigma-70 family RNA polymerase sigma factor [Bacilli bacterium]|nr:sigma-70 family RNA polymerase sigma factor [Acholeplasmataceae bacterium]MDY2903301.1 sigma-70 family RNA polymerase sigma factor [Bacilli bacterium]
MDNYKNIIRCLKSSNMNTVNQAFEILYNEYAKLVYLIISRSVKDKRDVEELTNDTFIKIFNNRYSLMQEKNLKYYIVTIANNLVKDYWKKKSENISYDSDYVLKQHDSKVETVYDDLIEVLKLHLLEKDVEILILHLFEGVSFKEIAKKYNQKLSAISNRYYRALEKLKEENVIDEIKEKI